MDPERHVAVDSLDLVLIAQMARAYRSRAGDLNDIGML